ncbi:quinol:cytochrome c oxidoreductase monoheme cytochrome subunit [Thermobaculum terrenum ATCC BAA-798]|uniref:Quinol:cytochrome c oxidoreductase monoheme cytochrome subunit n=1 Tax=Thermobaculum terrenum (strain ATCC BAA-798 / CCMEE 7001 / YNP1) TaxID=525904 RepID=D1CCI3_THET1|nr:cytochrome c [Thermobaculum terrenum]ACZ42498.1 quinol:cytochrome c oxidoreductase monoheme cytochrome subunit [Thermobaculum terrenum ATCC BAA-798]
MLLHKILRYKAGSILLLLLLSSSMLVACAGNMREQPHIVPYEESDFFPDKLSARQPPAHTIARGQLDDDPILYGPMGTPTPSQGSASASQDVYPFAITKEVLERGQERFNIYCSPCHGRAGDGNGMIVKRGYKHPPSFYEQRLINAPASHFFDVITNGFGSMPDYKAQVAPQDRWAIIAYIRALQLSHNATIQDVPADKRGELEK